jgi:membrane protein YqaA with SNARE-associated domain
MSQATESAAPLAQREEQGWQERILLRILTWADAPGSNWILFFVPLVQSAFIPVPSLLVFVTLSLGAVNKSFRFALICTAGSVIGGAIAYFIGYNAWSAVRALFIPLLFSERLLIDAEMLYAGNIFLALLASSFLPISYQICAIAAGVLKVNFWMFLLASCLARTVRFLLLAVLVYCFGDKAKQLITAHLRWAAWLILFFLLLFGGFALALRKWG